MCHYIILLWQVFFLLSLRSQQDLKPYNISGFAQGTSYRITYYAEDSIIPQAEIENILSEIDSSLSIYKPYSLISRINRSSTGSRIDKHFEKVVRKAMIISRKTGGAFDITVLPLVQAWGFGTAAITTLPDSAVIQSLLKCVGIEKISLRRDRIHKEKPCVQIDMNGIAQGYTVDVMAKYLEKKGLHNYLVELGGEIRVKGRKQPNGELMAIGIEGPAGERGSYPIQQVIRIKSGAVTTSGNYRKYHQYGPKKITHLIDPKTGYPLENRMISATVVANDAMTADGYDNALMGMGLEKALQFVNRRKNMEAYFIYHKKDGTVTDTATAGFYKLIE